MWVEAPFSYWEYNMTAHNALSLAMCDFGINNMHLIVVKHQPAHLGLSNKVINARRQVTKVTPYHAFHLLSFKEKSRHSFVADRWL